MFLKKAKELLFNMCKEKITTRFGWIAEEWVMQALSLVGIAEEWVMQALSLVRMAEEWVMQASVLIRIAEE